ncbi:vitellogenin [Megachile rotundata]|uniref:vitellogenin n=1 Tax=Megachile rotundata TaxID=143995 RepID=UPI003FD2E1FB
MWLPLTLLVLAGVVSADYQHGWKVGDEYTYLVRSRTLTSLDVKSSQYAGILIKGFLTVQAKDTNTLIAKLWKGQYSRIHKELPEGWETRISDHMLEFRDLPITEKPFQIILKHGVIVDMIVDKDIPTWEVNLLKSVVSQLQVDSQGENIIKSQNVQVPDDDEPYGSFKVMEDTVGGKCEVLYDITPLSDHMLHTKPELVPKPELKGDGQHIDIMKTKNFDKCAQRMSYHFGITGQSNWEPGANKNGKFLSKYSTSRIVISGNLKRFTIQTSVTTSQMFVTPRMYENHKGIVASRMNLTLGNVNKISNPLPLPRNPESTGNLVYVYSNPFSDMEERRPSDRRDSKQDLESDSISSQSSSEEINKNKINLLKNSGSSSASSSSISSSEEHKFWQPKPTLQDAPQNPLLPNYIGYKGKYIGKSGEIDVIKAVKQLVFEIANELEDSTLMPTQETLEKFSILTSLIRTMSRSQIEEVENILHLSSNELKFDDKTQAVKQNAWAVFRDAITQAGTGPAFLTIKNWIEKRNIGTWEAADILSALPRTSRTPTAEYIRTFFELVTNPKVINEPFLNTAVLMSFTELVHQSQVDGKSIHNLYPVHTFGRLTSKHDQTLLQEYIPYLAGELKKAVREGNSERIQTYIVALGNIGHPKILSVFEPYLEGKEQATVFQRTLMVGSLSKLAVHAPKLARSVLYKIYLNTMESHEVRCMAVFLLPITNPPLTMLQRMAEFTNYDTNKQVNSAVKSTIETLAELTDPTWLDLARRARSVMNIMNKEDYSYQYSHGFIFSAVQKEQNLINTVVMNYIGGDNGLTPRAVYLESLMNYGGFKTPSTEFMAMISDVQPLIEALTMTTDKPSFEKMATEKIAEQLKIVADKTVEMEGNILWRSKFLSKFIPFDKNTVHNMRNQITKNMMSMKDGGYVNLNKLMSYDVTLSFPTETGLPFVYTLRVPVLHKLIGTGQMKMDRERNVNVQSELRFTYSRKIQGIIGFVAPFEHQHYIAGVDANMQVYLPLKLSLEVNVPKTTLQLRIWPLKGEEKSRLLHYSVVPYTSIRDILSLRPLQKDKNTQLVHVNKDLKGSQSDKLKGIRVELEADSSDTEFWNMDMDKLRNMFPMYLGEDVYRKVDIFMNLDREVKEPLTLLVSYGTMDVKPGSENLQQWTEFAKAVEPSNKEANSEDRKKQFLKEAVKGIKLGKSWVVDLQLQIPDEDRSSSAMTLAWSTSNAESKGRTLLFWRCNIPSKEIKHEVCAASQFMNTPVVSLFFDKVIKAVPKTEFDIDIRYGKTCADNQQINVIGKATQSKEMKDEIMKSDVVKSCEKHLNHENKLLRVCQKAAALAMTLDEMDISVDIRSKPLRDLVAKNIHLPNQLGLTNANVDLTNPKNAGKDKIDLKMKLWKDKSGRVVIHTPTMDVLMDDLDLSFLEDDSESLVVPFEMDSNNLKAGTNIPSCVMDRTRAETFDGKEFPLTLGSCWRVLMTTYPKEDPKKPGEKLTMSEADSVSILARETNEKKEVKVILGKTEIKLVPTGQLPEVIVNGQKVQVTSELGHQVRHGDEVAFEIFQFGDRSIALASEKFDVKLVFDGKRIMIRTSNKFRDSIRGLCGNFDGDRANDFTSPKNCLLRKPEEFIASYTLTKDQCEGEDVQEIKKLQQANCVPQMSARTSNVINDIESGRSNVLGSNWGYHQDKQTDNKRCTIHRTKVIERNGQLCFTIRPVISCSPTCNATEMKTKNYQFHCTEKNEWSMKLKQRVEKGANPDLSQKSISMSQSIEVPLACVA